MAYQQIMRQLTRMLYPVGRAFQFPLSGDIEKLHAALAESESRAYNDAISLLNSVLPDNDHFTADDATDWERRLAIISNPAVSLANRKLAIAQKISYPNTNAPRQNYLFIQEQLRAAGFDVYVYKNNFGGVTMSPEDLLGTGSLTRFGAWRFGQKRMGGAYNNKIANSIEDAPDANFSVGSNLRFTFYISSGVLTNFATIPAARKAEFRQLVLMLKPAHTVAYLFVNFI